ncbi:hypothetical protein [Microbispora sp. NBC_01389]|uniref:hypothetical protein n=1 Tax=Microbispora sp. NBC_01389 TaxID=2903584 RepID=UPI0032445C5A
MSRAASRSRRRTARSARQVFTPGYQGRLVSPGVKIGDKPAGYAPAVRNRAPGGGA